MSFDKVEVRVFSGPDQVQVGSNTEPDLIVMNIGPKGDTGATGNTGATGPAGPNSVTIATTSDGTANLALNNVSTASFTAGNSSTTSGEITIFTNGPVFQWRSDTIEYGERGFTFLTTDITSEVNYTLPNASGTIALTTSNVSTATALETSRNIFGIAFNGTANVAGDATNTGHFASIPTGGQAGHFVTLNGTAPTVVAGRSAWWSDGSGNPSFRNGTGTAVTLVKSSDLGTNVANFLATPTSDNLASALTDENGTGGGFVRAEGATLTSPALVGPVNLTSQDASTANRVMNRSLGDERYLDWYNSVRLSPSELSTQHSAGGTTTANFRGITIFNITTAASSTALIFSKIAYFAGESSSLLFSYSKNRLLSFTTNRFTLRAGAVAEATICDNLPINNSKAFGVRFTTSNCAAFVRNGTIETVGAAVSALPYSRFILDYIAGSRLDVYGVIAGSSPTLLSTVNSGLPTGNGGSDLSNLILCLYDTGSGGAAANAGFSNIIFHTKP